MNTIDLKNYQLDSLIKCLNYPMNFQKSRVKMRFLKILVEKNNEVTKSRLEMLNTLSNKDAKGKPVLKDVTDEKGNTTKGYDLSPENMQKFHKEFVELMNESCSIDVLDSMKSDLPQIKQLINESEAVLDNRETAIIEEILSLLDPKKPIKEEVKEEKNA